MKQSIKLRSSDITGICVLGHVTFLLISFVLFEKKMSSSLAFVSETVANKLEDGADGRCDRDGGG